MRKIANTLNTQVDGDDIKITPVTVIYFVVNLTTSSDFLLTVNYPNGKSHVRLDE